MASALPRLGRDRRPAAQLPGDEALLPVESNVLLTIGVMTATLLQILDTTIANVAIPHM